VLANSRTHITGSNTRTSG